MSREDELKIRENVEGRVFDIERYATEDGPGIRTVVFFKGCPLRCKWCANPESLRRETDILYYQNLCTGCGKCVESCPAGAIRTSKEYGLVTDVDKCTGCGLCAKSCFFSARRVSGKTVTVGEVMQTVLKDKAFYETSGGGVTISGGEPFMQPEFLEALLRHLVSNGIHTAIETSGAPIKEEKLAAILSLLDIVYLDVKHVDPVKFKQNIGVDNAPIMDNIRRIAGMHANVIFRIPCIPGFNLSLDDMRDILFFIKQIGRHGNKRVELLPYHRLGRDKYKCLGREYLMGDTSQLDKSDLAQYADIGRQMGLTVSIGAV